MPERRETEEKQVCNSENSGVRQRLRDHWAVESNYARDWNARAEIASSFLLPGETAICDIGCGPHRPLLQFLPEECRYLPADLKAWSPDVEMCDLNDLHLPNVSKECDVVFLLGVLEYLFNVQEVLSALADNCGTVIFSYCSTDDGGPRMPLWVNAYAGDDIFRIMKAARLVLEKATAYKTGQYVIRAKKLG